MREQYSFGFGTDLPVTGDYDGDGKTDIAVYRAGVWLLKLSALPTQNTTIVNSERQPIRRFLQSMSDSRKNY